MKKFTGWLARKLMELGWKSREKKLAPLALVLLYIAKTLFTWNEDWFNVTECLNHIAYTYSLMGTYFANKGYETSLLSDEFALGKGSKRTHIIRAIVSTGQAAGAFEALTPYFPLYLDVQQSKGDRGDMLSKQALNQLRCGSTPADLWRLSIGALAQLKLGGGAKKNPIWYVNAGITHALICLLHGTEARLVEGRNWLDEVGTIIQEKNLINQLPRYLHIRKLFETNR